jgi:hypothetical protein
MTIEEVQSTVKGSSAPAPWEAADFARASEVFDEVLTIRRESHKPIRIGRAGTTSPPIGIRISEDGMHATATHGFEPGAQLYTPQQLRVGVPGILQGVRASGRGKAARSGRAARGIRPLETAGGELRPGSPTQADPSFGPCSGAVPPAVPEIKTLMAALPCNLPGNVDGWMRKQGFHLQRILAAEPSPEDGFATDEARWRYEMAVLGPKMEFELLRHRAGARDAKWAQGLGASLPVVRALLPPLEPAAWRAWDGRTLLAELREALATRTVRQPARPPATDGGVCALLERGRIPAAKAALYGEAVLPHPAPSRAMQAELQLKNPQPETPHDVVSAAEWQRAAQECEQRCSTVRDRVSANDLLRAARMQRAGASAGPDGWSGLYLRRLATLFPTEVAELMWHE